MSSCRWWIDDRASLFTLEPMLVYQSRMLASGCSTRSNCNGPVSLSVKQSHLTKRTASADTMMAQSKGEACTCSYTLSLVSDRVFAIFSFTSPSVIFFFFFFPIGSTGLFALPQLWRQIKIRCSAWWVGRAPQNVRLWANFSSWHRSTKCKASNVNPSHPVFLCYILPS